MARSTEKFVQNPRNPAVAHLTQVIEERIEQGNYQSGTWLPTERALSEEFAVDRSVVRAAFLQLEARQLIVRAQGRRPWVKERALPVPTKTNQTRRGSALQTLAVILPHQEAFVSSLAVLRGINQTLRLQSSSFRLQIFDNYGDGAREAGVLEQKALQAVEDEGLGGVILWHMGDTYTLPDLQHLMRKSVPVVFIDRCPSELNCDFVGVDNRHSAQRAVNHLLAQGHRRIAHLTHPDWASPVRERYDGYCDALRLAGIEVTPELVLDVGALPSPCKTAADYFFHLDPAPTAVFAVNDGIAHSLIAEVERSGRHVPDDLSVIGFDDIERFSPRPAILTTLRNPFDLMGRRAAELLLHRMEARHPAPTSAKHILLETMLIERKTTRNLAS